nr:NAD(P)/FAD-dependent oxidoreductase [Campylobacter rectus]
MGYAQSGRQGSGDESDLPCKGAAKACENASGASRNENNFSTPYKDSSVSSGDQALLQTGNASPPEKAVPLTFSKSDKKIEFNKPNADFVISQEIKFDGGGKSSSRKNTVNLRQKTQRKFVGDILFTHKGISGPAVLNASLFWQKGLIAINFCPNFNIETARKSKKQLSTILPLPRRFTLEFLRAAGLGDKPYGEYKADELEKISRLFCYKFAPAGTFGFERAEVTKGGVDTDVLDANCGHNGTRGLYFIGEVLNVTGMLGGYNLHFAFACAANLAKRLNARRACLADY